MAYKYERKGEVDFTKDGHTMFHDDVLSDLRRKSYLEQENKNLKLALTKITQDCTARKSVMIARNALAYNQ